MSLLSTPLPQPSEHYEPRKKIKTEPVREDLEDAHETPVMAAVKVEEGAEEGAEEKSKVLKYSEDRTEGAFERLQLCPHIACSIVFSSLGAATGHYRVVHTTDESVRVELPAESADTEDPRSSEAPQFRPEPIDNRAWPLRVPKAACVTFRVKRLGVGDFCLESNGGKHLTINVEMATGRIFVAHFGLLRPRMFSFPFQNLRDLHLLHADNKSSVVELLLEVRDPSLVAYTGGFLIEEPIAEWCGGAFLRSRLVHLRMSRTQANKFMAVLCNGLGITMHVRSSAGVATRAVRIRRGLLTRSLLAKGYSIEELNEAFAQWTGTAATLRYFAEASVSDGRSIQERLQAAALLGERHQKRQRRLRKRMTARLEKEQRANQLKPLRKRKA